jgi:hypothetical protein
MKCRTFKVKLSGVDSCFAEVEFNKFLESVTVNILSQKLSAVNIGQFLYFM